MSIFPLCCTHLDLLQKWLLLYLDIRGFYRRLSLGGILLWLFKLLAISTNLHKGVKQNCGIFPHLTYLWLQKNLGNFTTYFNNSNSRSIVQYLISDFKMSDRTSPNNLSCNTHQEPCKYRIFYYFTYFINPFDYEYNGIIS